MKPSDLLREAMRYLDHPENTFSTPFKALVLVGVGGLVEDDAWERLRWTATKKIGYGALIFHKDRECKLLALGLAAAIAESEGA